MLSCPLIKQALMRQYLACKLFIAAARINKPGKRLAVTLSQASKPERAPRVTQPKTKSNKRKEDNNGKQFDIHKASNKRFSVTGRIGLFAVQRLERVARNDRAGRLRGRLEAQIE